MSQSASRSTSPRQRRHDMRFGALLNSNSVEFNLWAPSVEAPKLCLYEGANERILDLPSAGDGWYRLDVPGLKAGQKYHYLVNDLRVPDPASRYQPEGVHGPSVVTDPLSFSWKAEGWRGLPWEQSVIYELHVGCFSDAGTFGGVTERLDHLQNLGITAIELMPLSAFPGERNWGYDGVLHFAPASCYGHPDDLKALVDAAHQRGMMVFLDVVYNHFGPEGNYLYVHSKPFFTEKYKTPWGAAIDFEGRDSATVRQFFIDNALYWLNEFHIDGLRFDAVHAIYDESKVHFLEDLARSIKAGVDGNRYCHLVLENDNNESHLLERARNSQPQFFTAQWNDDFHHCAHVIATGEKSGYYADYTEGTSQSSALEHFARVLNEGFAYQGQPSNYRKGEPRGEVSAHLPPAAFVSFLQNHDQIGNRAFGERLSELTSRESLQALTAILLLSPQIPLLFMGEEWASKSPFYFFCDFGPELAPAVTAGRREEFAAFEQFRDEKVREKIPDPISLETFSKSTLDWNELGSEAHCQHRDFVRNLIDLRKREIVPVCVGAAESASEIVAEQVMIVRWRFQDKLLLLVANLDARDIAVELPEECRTARVLYSSETADHFMQQDDSSTRLQPWSVTWLVSNAK